MENIEYEKINKIKGQIKSLKIIITTQINIKFKKLINKHKELLIKYLLKICLLCGIYFQFDNFIEKLCENNCQDIFSLLNLLFPYYDLNSSPELDNLDSIFKNSNNKAISFDSSYYIDHLQFASKPDYLEEYFENITKSLDSTFLKVGKKLLPNWINVFPYTLNSYKNSSIYDNFRYLVKNKKFINSSSLLEYIDTNSQNENINLNKEFFNQNLLIGYNNLYGCVYNFLYSDIKTIKWMIFDLMIKNIPVPNIIILSDELSISKVANIKWEQLDSSDKFKIKEKWNKLLVEDNKFPLVRALVLFYLRWESNIDEIRKINIDRECKKILFTKLKEDEEDKIDDNLGIFGGIAEKLNNCIKLVSKKIDFSLLYNYIYKCMQKFRYTWYGYVCLDLEHNILTMDNYLENYNLLYPELNFLSKDKFLITPKNIYNFFKSLINDKSGESEYTLISNSFCWDSVDLDVQNKFIQRLNTMDNNKNWFNISNNIARVYSIDLSDEKNKDFVNNVIFQIKNTMVNKDIFVKIILETLIINNMLSFVQYNPKLTSSSSIPDKNKENDKWKKYYKDNVNIEKYADSYSFLSNRKLSSYNKILDDDNNESTIYNIIKSTNWFNTFGSNWIAQIQVYHHILNQRTIFVTGATGVGKSTTFPFVTLYGHKMLFFNNGAKILCTQPRVQPAKDNSTFVAKYLGSPFIKEKYTQMVKNRPKEKIKYIEQNINYLQFKTKNESIVDDEYHPTLRYCTDGSLFVQLKDNYLLKKSDPNNNQMTKENMYNCVLVDEAHEHNVNMDLILTLMRFTTYINNQVLLGIVSATMENDEITYRKYYELIDDNWKWPLDLKYKDWSNLNYNSNQIDRRLHLSPPFMTTNFKIDETVQKVINKQKINEQIVSTVKTILNTTPSGDILVFQNGEKEINDLVKLLNENTPDSVIAIPFYSNLDPDILENYIKKIARPDIRRKIINKKTVSIEKLLDSEFNENEKVNPGTYQRFIIVATNIAEASITIDSLKFVIDTGEQKISVYDPSKDLTKLVVKPIAIPNQKQRKGRVGRVQPGSVFYLYDIGKLESRVIFKINTDNITGMLIGLLTSSDTKLIDELNDPYKTLELDKIPEFLRSQYSYLNQMYKSIIYSNTKLIHVYTIPYPYSDGKYNIETLIDRTGKFYIVHPNELEFERDFINDLNILNNNPKISNTPEKIFQINKSKKLIDDSNKLTPYGQLVSSISDLFVSDMENISTDTKIATLILDTIGLGFNVDSELFKMVILFAIFKENRIQYKKMNMTGKADYLIQSSIIPDQLFNFLPIDKIIEKLNPDFRIEDIIKMIEPELNKMIGKNINVLTDKNNYKILLNYYKFKILFKIIIGSDTVYPEFFKNRFLKKIMIKNNIKYSNKIINAIKMLDNYNILCLLIVKNYPYNIYTSVLGTANMFVEYFNNDVNRVYQIDTYVKFNGTTVYNTNLKLDQMGTTIFAFDVKDPNKLTNLVSINNGIFNILKYLIDTSNIKYKNYTINKDEIISLYGSDSNKIFEKIDKIIETFKYIK